MRRFCVAIEKSERKMEGKLKCSPELGYPVDGDDAKYVSRLSTILVATIQDAKDRISQIEYIFCNQLYPNFQSRSNSLEKSYSEGKKEAEDVWKDKERDLLLQIDKLQLEMQEAVKENHRLKLEKEKSVGELYDEQLNSVPAKIKSHQLRIEELEHDVMQKSREVDEGMELQNKLLQNIQTNASTILDQERQLKEHEDCKEGLLIKMKGLEEKIEELQGDLERKTRALEWEKEQGRDFLRNFDSLTSQVAHSVTKEEKLEKENEEHKYKLKCMENDVCKLIKEHRKKTEEIEGEKTLQVQLVKQIDGSEMEMLKQKQQLEESEKDRKLLAGKVHDLEKKVNNLQENLDHSSKEAKLKSSELWAIRKQEKDLTDAHKKLKSLNNLLFTKFVITTDNMLSPNKLEDETGALKLQTDDKSSTAACETREVMIKNEFVDALEDKSVKVIPAVASTSVDAETRKEYEDFIKELLVQMQGLEDKIEELYGDLEQKTRALEREEVSGRDLRRQTDSLISQVVDSVTKSEELEKESKKLKFRLECAEDDILKLQKVLKEKTEEIDGGQVSQAQLLKQIDQNNVKIMKQEEQLEEYGKDRKLLVDKIHDLEKKVNEHQEVLGNVSKEAVGKHSNEKLLQEVELKSSELLAERKKKGDLVDAYKKLKSQYNFLCSKFGLTMDNMLPKDKFENENGGLKLQISNTSSIATCDVKEVKIDKDSAVALEDEAVRPFPGSAINFPSSVCIAPRGPPSVKSDTTIGTKRPASCWIGTRSRPRKEGHDPHDDFLDTPLENLRRKLNITTKEEVQDVYIPKTVNSDSPDDETQDANGDTSPEKEQMPFSVAGKKGFKYIEPVRNKVERENLKGIECKQCKKFYDAVLPDNRGRDAHGNKHNLRCEHHDGVSRHRYKYVPPMTPEGFWNIGFESEM